VWLCSSQSFCAGSVPCSLSKDLISRSVFALVALMLTWLTCHEKTMCVFALLFYYFTLLIIYLYYCYVVIYCYFIVLLFVWDFVPHAQNPFEVKFFLTSVLSL
jgi:hypothetical protein